MNYPNVEVHYFEPHKQFADQLKGIVNYVGLSNEIGEGIYYPKTQSFVVKEGEAIIYKLITLDYYAKNIPRIDFLKIDAEGMDYRILQGGKETLKKVRYVQFEYWDGVQKFVDLLPDFDLFLIPDSRLYNEVIKPRTSDEKYTKLLVPLTQDVIDLIDKTLIPLGAGGNIFGIKK